MPVSIKFIASSETYGSRGFALRDNRGNTIRTVNGQFTEADGDIRDRGTFPDTHPISIDILNGYINNNNASILVALNQLDGVLSEFYAIIEISGVRRIRNVVNVSKSRKRVQDPNTNTWVKDMTLVKRYRINGYIKTPYHSEYLINDSGDVNCMKQLALAKWPKYSKKTINKYFESTTIGDIIDFTDYYKIPTHLVNQEGFTIYKNSYPSRKHKKPLFAMIMNNHIYPTIDGKRKPSKEIKNVPSSLTKEDIDDEYLENNAVMSIDGTYYTPDGVVSETFGKLNKEFFNSIRTNNFTYRGDAINITPLSYLGETQSMKYEYDMMKAYGKISISKEISKCKVPIFSCFDIWEEFNTNEGIKEENYYLIKDLNNVYKCGQHSNLITGRRLLIFMKYGKLSYKDIDSVKKPKTTIEFPTNKFKKLKDDLIKEGLSKGDAYNMMRNYIGILSTTSKTKTTKLFNLPEGDEAILNMTDERWHFDSYEEEDNTNGTFFRSFPSYNHLNNLTIANHIIDCTSCILLKSILLIEKKHNLLPSKIRVDSITYDREVELYTPKLFRVVCSKGTTLVNKQKLFVKRENIKSGHKQNLQHYRRDKLKEIILDQLSKCSNSTITGSPGVGKTFIMKQKPVWYQVSATYTNMCKRNMNSNAYTLHSLFQQYPDNGKGERKQNILHTVMNKNVWIDEFSMIPWKFWGFIVASCLYYNTKYIFTGDINQIAPVKEGEKIDMDNYIVKAFMGNVETLTKDYRNDKDLIELRDKILHADDYKLILKNEIEKKPFDMFERHICYTHDMRKAINLHILKKHGYEFEFNGNKLNVSVGVLLKARANNKDVGIVKSSLWRVMERDGDTYKLKDIDTGEELETNQMKYFDLGYANTYHSTQGLTITEDLCLHEIYHFYSNKNVIYTGITRAKERSKVHIYDNIKIIYDSYWLPKVEQYGE